MRKRLADALLAQMRKGSRGKGVGARTREGDETKP
jgi:hypothetical protein